MKNEKHVFEFGNDYRCVEFHDIDPEVSGVEVYNADTDERLGSIVGLLIPDIEDEEENIKFDSEVVEWLVENE